MQISGLESDYQVPAPFLCLDCEVPVKMIKKLLTSCFRQNLKILVSTAVRLAPFNLPQIKAITDHDKTDLYSQAFQALYYNAALYPPEPETWLPGATLSVLEANTEKEETEHEPFGATL